MSSTGIFAELKKGCVRKKNNEIGQAENRSAPEQRISENKHVYTNCCLANILRKGAIGARTTTHRYSMEQCQGHAPGHTYAYILICPDLPTPILNRVSVTTSNKVQHIIINVNPSEICKAWNGRFGNRPSGWTGRSVLEVLLRKSGSDLTFLRETPKFQSLM
jgi:hypothetical protein